VHKREYIRLYPKLINTDRISVILVLCRFAHIGSQMLLYLNVRTHRTTCYKSPVGNATYHSLPLQRCTPHVDCCSTVRNTSRNPGLPQEHPCLKPPEAFAINQTQSTGEMCLVKAVGQAASARAYMAVDSACTPRVLLTVLSASWRISKTYL
jgi:hypothetical protein